MQALSKGRKRLLFLLVFIVSIAFQTNVLAEDLDEVRELLREGYYQPVSEEILAKPTIDEILAALDDPYTEFFTIEQFADFQNDIDLNYVGIGIIGEENPQGVRVDYLFEKGAAAQSKLEVDDIILEADGTSLEGKPMEDSQQYLLGNPGTTVELKVYRPSTDETYTEAITRMVTEYAPTVDSAWLAGNIGYIGLHSFNEHSLADLKEAIRALNDVDGWIFDLRFNGGGYLDTAQDVAGLFPGVDTALVVEGQDHSKIAFKAMKQSPQLYDPIILLINGESASAAEIVAGAVKDYQAGTLYGQTTFGKGIAQSVYELESGNLFKMTVAQFYSPSGQAIHENGVEPDVETEAGEELFVAHRDMIFFDETVEMIETARFTESLAQNPVFTVELEHPLPDGEFEQQVSLHQLAGQEVDVVVKPQTLTTYTIEPSELLNPYSMYLLKIETDSKSYGVEFATSENKNEVVETTANFTDVKDNAYFATSINVLANEGLIKGIGNGKFGPYHYITREQAATLFARIFKLDTDNVSDPGFKDVQPDDYFYASVAAVKEAGIMSGKLEDRFGTGSILTREEMAALLARAFNLQLEEGQVPFSDIGPSPFARDILKVYQSGIARGSTETTFSPNKGVTRGEFAIFLHRALIHDQGAETGTIKTIK